MEDEQEILKIRQRIEEFVPNILDKAPSEDEVRIHTLLLSKITQVKELLGHLRKLEDVKIDRTLLQNTRIGAALTKLAKSPSKDIDVLKDTAVKLTSKWKDTLRQQASSKENSDDAPLKRQKTEPADGNADSQPKYQYLLHNQDIRDKALVYIFNAFTAVPGSGYDYKKVSKLAYDVECGLFDKYLVNQSNQKEYTLKLKSIAFNLRDPKNATFRNKIYNGDIDANKVAAMESAEMASDEKKMERINILQESLEACQSDWAVKNILMSKDGKKKGQFKCFKCNSSETVYHQLQTRSSDEPMTTFVTCLQCNNRWKF